MSKIVMSPQEVESLIAQIIDDMISEAGGDLSEEQWSKINKRAWDMVLWGRPIE